MPLKVVVQPTGEQITLAEARLHLRLDDDGDSPAAHPDDPWLTGIGIPAAREYCEGWLGRALAPQTIEYTRDVFADSIYLPMAPVVSLTSVKYTDSAQAIQTLASGYDFDNYSEPARIRLGYGATWPTIYDTPNAVKIRYEAGYSLPGDSPNTNPLPFALRAAMLLVLGALYEQRENVSADKLEDIPLGAQSLMMPYRLRLAMA